MSNDVHPVFKPLVDFMSGSGQRNDFKEGSALPLSRPRDAQENGAPQPANPPTDLPEEPDFGDSEDSDYCECGAIHGEEELDGILRSLREIDELSSPTGDR